MSSGPHPYHALLVRQLKRLGIELSGEAPTPEQWQQMLDRVNRAYTERDQERYLLERSQEIASREKKELYERFQEAQRIAGLGNWVFDEGEGRRHWSQECLRIFEMDHNAPMPNYKELLKRIHEKDRWRLKKAAYAAWRDGKHFEIEFRVLLPGGGTRWVRVLGQPVLNRHDVVSRVHGTVMDITGRKLIELRQFIEHSVTRLLSESVSPVAVMPEIIQVICEALGWKCGAFWVLNRLDGAYRRVAAWSTNDRRVQQFYRCSTDKADSYGGGDLIERTAQAGIPVWMEDVASDSGFGKRCQPAAEAGLHAAFAFPIQQANGDVLGVLEFFNNRSQEVDPATLLSAHFIGRQIGQFFQRKLAEHALRESEAHFRALVEQASDSFYVLDIKGRFLDVNQRACDSLGYTREELLQMTVADVDIELTFGDVKELSARIDERGPIALESTFQRKDGTTFPVEIRLGPIEVDSHQHLLALVRDVTERTELQDQLQHLAYHDPLTNLPNRAKFNGHLTHAIAQSERYHKRFAILFIDLDRFKNVNDTLGHDVGDRLLQEMAHRLSGCLREGDLVARLGGDEFVVLVEEMDHPTEAGHVAQKILDALVKEYPLQGQSLHMTASIGISTFPEDGADESTLMKNADIAMYRAKERGKNNFQFYSAQMSAHSSELLALESALRRAVLHDELVLHYQPTIDVNSGRITGVEALVRWRHPTLGLVRPENFIGLAEETGMIISIGRWALARACEQARLWREQELAPLRIAVNLSARQFSDENLLQDISLILKQTGMNASLLDIEITESVVMANTDKAVDILTRLREMGAQIAIDDFGMGYSSLAHFRRLPIDILKIDRSFIKGIPGGRIDEVITDSVIKMGKKLDIRIVAEGVENAEQYQFLLEHGCDEIQGNYFSEALVAEELASLVRENMVLFAGTATWPQRSTSAWSFYGQ